MTGVGMAFLGVFLISIAVFLLTPWLLLPLIRLLGLLARTQTGQLALANALRAPKRTVSTGRAVLVGTLVVTTVLTGHSVMNASITHMMDKAFPISAIGSYGGGTSANGAETVEKAKKALNNVTSVPNVEYATLSYAAGVVEINPARKLHRIGG